MISRLEKIRKARGLSQSALSRRSGITQQWISQLEADPRKIPGIDVAAALAKVLDLSPLQLWPRTPQLDKESRWVYFSRTYPELVQSVDDVDRARLFISVSCLEESAFRAMTSILNPRPPKWNEVRERLLLQLKALVRDADLVGLMEE